MSSSEDIFGFSFCATNSNICLSSDNSSADGCSSAIFTISYRGSTITELEDGEPGVPNKLAATFVRKSKAVLGKRKAVALHKDPVQSSVDSS
uniref:PHO2 n=1 Tax=Arundo donax TaxID=35708 RepID=A0A0A8YS00_ARUDO